MCKSSMPYAYSLDPRYHRIMNVTLSNKVLLSRPSTRNCSMPCGPPSAYPSAHRPHIPSAIRIYTITIDIYIDIYIALRVMAQPEFDMQGETPQYGSSPAPTSISEDTKGWCSECWSKCTFNTNWDKANSTQSICLYISRSQTFPDTFGRRLRFAWLIEIHPVIVHLAIPRAHQGEVSLTTSHTWKDSPSANSSSPKATTVHKRSSSANQWRLHAKTARERRN